MRKAGRWPEERDESLERECAQGVLLYERPTSAVTLLLAPWARDLGSKQFGSMDAGNPIDDVVVDSKEVPPRPPSLGMDSSTSSNPFEEDDGTAATSDVVVVTPSTPPSRRSSNPFADEDALPTLSSNPSNPFGDPEEYTDLSPRRPSVIRRDWETEWSDVALALKRSLTGVAVCSPELVPGLLSS
jgi:hypothetical protein